jgi:hypothetical protein
MAISNNVQGGNMKQLLAIAILGMLLTGCSKSVDSKSKTFTYPLALGNQWTYSVTLTWKHGDPIRVDTIWGNSGIVNLTVAQVDTIRPGVLSYTIRGIDVGSEMRDGIPERTYLNLPEGMYLLSRKTVMSINAGAIMPRRVPHPPDIVSGHPPLAGFPNAFGLAAALANPAGLITAQTADLADTLPLVLAYPQHTGLIWTYRDSSDARPSRVEKVIEGRETITTPAGSFDCWRIRFIFTPPSDGDLVDYVSPEGLIRRRFEGRLWNGLWTTTYDLTSFTLH